MSKESGNCEREARELTYKVVKSFTLPNGGSMRVTIATDTPIREQDFPILRESIAVGMGEYLQTLGDVMRPKPEKSNG